MGIPELIPSFVQLPTEDKQEWDVSEEFAKIELKDNGNSGGHTGT